MEYYFSDSATNKFKEETNMRATEIRTKEDAKKVIIEQLAFFAEENLLDSSTTLATDIDGAIEGLIDCNSDTLTDAQINLLCSFSRALQVKQAIHRLGAAFYTFNRLISAEDLEVLSERYPFTQSLDELAANVTEWCDEMIDNIDNLAD